MNDKTAFDQSKAGLQDDHDPSDIGQRSADKKRGVKPVRGDKQKPETPPDADSIGGGSQAGM